MMKTQWINCGMIGVAFLLSNANAQHNSPYYLRAAIHDVLGIPWKDILSSANDDWVMAHIYPSADSGEQIKGDNRGFSAVAGTAHVTWLFIDRKETLEYQFEEDGAKFISGPRSHISINPHAKEPLILFRIKGKLTDNFVPYNDPGSLERRHIVGSVYALPLEWEGKVAEALAYFAQNDGKPEGIVESVKHENPLITIGSVAMAERKFDGWLRCLRATKRWKTGEKRDELVEYALLLGTLNSARRLPANRVADRQTKKSSVIWGPKEMCSGTKSRTNVKEST